MKAKDLFFIEEELKKRWSLPYQWGRNQNDIWDSHSNFIYQCITWEELVKTAGLRSAQLKLTEADFMHYCANRWYNFNSAMAVEQILSCSNKIVPLVNSRDRLVDFSLSGIDFDHKTSVYPRGFKKPLEFSRQNPKELIQWLYINQSREQRKHFHNRLFLITYDEAGDHWKLKAEISWLKELIEKYVATFDPAQLKTFEFEPGKITLSDIIWAVK